MQIEKLVEILNTINYPILMEIETEALWYIDDQSVVWNNKRNEEDLLNQEGETYSGYLPESYHIQDGYFICNIDTQCGQWVTHIFSMKNQVVVE